MIIKLYVNNSENNKLDKDITEVITLEGNLKTSTSITDPSIVIAGDLETIPRFNYMYIPAFNRYYFITDVVSIRDTFFEVRSHVDVLSSFKNEIRNNSAIIRKQEHAWNLYLDDGTFRAYQNPKIVLKNFPSGFSGHSYILLVAGS